MKKTIITVVGKDGVGIIAKICTYLANNNINIEDISQTITGGFFNMMMITDMNKTSKPFGDISDELAQIGDAQNLKRWKYDKFKRSIRNQ